MRQERFKIWGLLLFALLTFTTATIFAQLPGDTVGYTQYNYQTNGSTGNRIAVDNAGGVHFAWMWGEIGFTRRVYYSYLSPNGNWAWPRAGSEVSYRNQSGYCQIDATADDRAMIGYHCSESLLVAIDAYVGLGIFDYFRPSLNLISLRWPYLTISLDGNIHAIGSAGSQGSNDFFYARSGNGGLTWTAPALVAQASLLSPMIASSPVSNKAAIVFNRYIDSDVTQNDVYYIESSDGLNWDFDGGRVNITGYGGDTDSIGAYSDLDANYDYNDNLHIIWNAHWPSGDRVFLFHYDPLSGTIHEIALLDMPELDTCEFRYNLAINKMSIATDSSSGDLFAVYTRFDTSDCSRDGFANGEIYLQRSSDQGTNWTTPQNITNSRTPDCYDGFCASDIAPSVADKVTDYLHIFYLRETHCNWQNDPVCDGNVMLYYPYNIRETSLDGGEPSPRQFTLAPNYPNPFNAQTEIKFSLEKSSFVNLTIYDITGRKAAVLADGWYAAGSHTLNWDASGMSSGMYYYRLTTTSGSEIRKMMLLK